MNYDQLIAHQRMLRYNAKKKRLDENQDWNAVESPPIPSFTVERKKERFSLMNYLP